MCEYMTALVNRKNVMLLTNEMDGLTGIVIDTVLLEIAMN